MAMDPKQQRVLRDDTATDEDEPRDVSDDARLRAGKPGVGGEAAGRSESERDGAPNPRPQGKGG